MAEDVLVCEFAWKFSNQLLDEYDEVGLDLFLGAWGVGSITVFDDAHVVAMSNNVEVTELARRRSPENK